MQRVIIFGLLSVLSVGQGVMVAQSVSDSALGAWTLNHAKSTFSGAVPYRRVTKFEVVGDAIKETTYTMSTDKPSVVVEYTARFDGNDYPISNSILSTVSLKRVDDQTVERTGKIRGQVVETETRTVSDKGKVLTVTTKGTIDGTDTRAFRFTIDNHDRNAVGYRCRSVRAHAGAVTGRIACHLFPLLRLLTRSSIHCRMRSAICRLFLSCMIMWLLPRMPRSGGLSICA